MFYNKHLENGVSIIAFNHLISFKCKILIGYLILLIRDMGLDVGIVSIIAFNHLINFNFNDIV